MQIEVISIIPHQRDLHFPGLCSFSVQSLLQIFFGLLISLNCFDIRVFLSEDLQFPLRLHGQHLFLTHPLPFDFLLFLFKFKFQEAFFLFPSLPFHAFLESFQFSPFLCFLGFVFLLLYLTSQFFMSDGILHPSLIYFLQFQSIFFGSELFF